MNVFSSSSNSDSVTCNDFYSPLIWRFPTRAYLYNLSSPSFPESRSVVLQNINSSLTTYGYAVAALTPTEFALKNGLGHAIDQVNQAQLQNLRDILAQLRAANRIVTTLANIPHLFDTSVPTFRPVPMTTPPPTTIPPGPTSPPRSCNCVAFRVDGVQDYYLGSSLGAILNIFAEYNFPVTLGIIGAFFGDDFSLLTRISLSNKIDLANSGWAQEQYGSISFRGVQMEYINKTNTKIYQLFSKWPSTFIPPYGSFNDLTLQALEKLGLNHLSSFLFADKTDYRHNLQVRDPLVWQFPAGASTYDLNTFGVGYSSIFDHHLLLRLNSTRIFSDIQNQLSQYGVAVVSITPTEFTQSGQPSLAMLNTLRQVLNSVQGAGITPVFLKNLATYFNISPLPTHPLPTTSVTQSTTTPSGKNQDNSSLLGKPSLLLLLLVLLPFILLH
jgi:peptidoglycan/xylan/chitin deacetylase (PgdA/CDA1 family)